MLLVHIEGPLEPVHLNAAIARFIDRHEAWRSCFVEVEGGIEAVVREQVATPNMRWEDLRPLGQSEQWARLQSLAASEGETPFDLTEAPLLRITLVQTGAHRHVLVLSAHHLITDAWTENLFVTELAALYEQAVTGKPSALADVPLQYGDYAVWQRTNDFQQKIAEGLRFWKSQLDGARDLELPTDRPRQSVRSTRGARLAFHLPDELTRAAMELARRERVTPFILYLAAVCAVLSRYADKPEILIGTPAANRDRPELQAVVGAFINMLALRIPTPADATFAELVATTRLVTRAAMAHQDVPFGQVLATAGVTPDPSRTPLFPVAFQVDMESESSSGGDLQLRLQGIGSQTAKYDLSFMIQREGGYVEYSTELYDEDTVRRLVAQLKTLLGTASRAPNTTLGELPLLSPDERRAVIELGRGPRPAGPEMPVHELIAERGRTCSDAVAVSDALGNRLTYAELEERANGLAWHLVELGVRAEDRVALYMDRSVQLLVAMLGVMKTGACYVPLDPFFPRHRLAYMLEDSGARVVLVNDVPPAGAPSSTAVVYLSQLDRTAASPPPDTFVSPDQLVYMIYTSGSTGRPKGVMLSHANLLNFLVAMEPVLGERAPGSAWLAITSISFDISNLELLWPLAHRMHVMIAPDPLRGLERTARGEPMLADLCRRAHPSILQCTPSLAAILLEDDDLRACLAGLDTMLVGGEMLPAQIATDFALASSARLVNMYGPTETTIWSTSQDVSERQPTSTIGRPIANNDVFVLDQKMQPVPLGVAGNLFIGGLTLARGYHGRPALTAERFVPNPFTTRAGDRLYDTGDVARMLPDGRLDFLGRRDTQVKLHGHRIELGEIETALGAISGVRQAVVEIRGDKTPSSKLLAAYLLREPGKPLPSPHDLSTKLASTLPTYMVPSAYVELEEFPLTPNGKIDRRALPVPTVSAAPAKTDTGQPRQELETRLGAIFADILAVPSVEPDDNFYGLGGTSLNAIRLMLKVQSALGVSVRLNEFLQTPTVRGLVRLVAKHALSALPEPERANVLYPPTPLLHAHCLDGWDRGSLDPAWNFVEWDDIRGPFDSAAFRAAVRELTHRHEALRSKLVRRGTSLQFEICPAREPDFCLVDMTGMSEIDQGMRCIQLFHEFKRYRFRWHDDQRCRFALVQRSDREFSLLACYDHLASDAWSQAILRADLWRLYVAHRLGRPAELPPTYSFAALSHARSTMAAARLAQDGAYLARLRKRAQAMTPLAIDKTSGLSVRRSQRVPAPVVAAVREFARQHKTSISWVILTATHALRWLRDGGAQTCVIATLSGREDLRAEHTVGNFVRTIPIIVSPVGPGVSLEHLFESTQRRVLEAWQHLTADIEGTMLACNRWPLMGEYELNYAHQMSPQSLPSGLGMALSEREDPIDFVSAYYWALFVNENERHLEMFIEGRERYLSVDEAERCLEMLGVILDALVTRPEMTLGELACSLDLPARD